MESKKIFEVVSPIDNKVIHYQDYSTEQDIEKALSQKNDWQTFPLSQRIEILTAFLEIFAAKKQQIAEHICLQMGRPVHQALGEVAGVIERSKYLIDIAPQALADKAVADKHFLRRTPLGKILIISPWNYPYLTAINSIIPALLSGNQVILKHASQTPLCGQMLTQCFVEAGVPASAFSHLYLTHQQTEKLLKHPAIQFLCFTGSVTGGKKLLSQLRTRLIGAGLELGGKDPAIVLEDCNFEQAVNHIVDGSFFNSGQSCCGIERIYVAQSCYQNFVDAFVEQTKQYQLGDPRLANTTIGPMVNQQAAQFVRAQITDAITQGAQSLIDEKHFAASQTDSPYLAPQVLTGVNHKMRLMTQESFGPVVGIMPFNSIDEAVQLANDSQYGLSASIWTKDIERGIKVGDQIETGTVLLNRCDYLHPALAWTGVKDTGLGVSLSYLGFHQLTRVKSFNINRG